MSVTKSAKIQPFPVGSSQYPAARCWSSVTGKNGAISGVGQYAHLTTLPSVDMSSGVFLLGPMDPCVNLKMKFHGTHGTDASAKTGAFGLWGLEEFVDTSGNVEYLGDFLLAGNLTIGNTAVHASSKIILPASGVSHKFVSAITITSDLTRGAIKVGEVTDGVANLLFDFLSYPYYVLELRIGTATGIGAIHRTL